MCIGSVLAMFGLTEHGECSNRHRHLKVSGTSTSNNTLTKLSRKDDLWQVKVFVNSKRVGEPGRVMARARSWRNPVRRLDTLRPTRVLD